MYRYQCCVHLTCLLPSLPLSFFLLFPSFLQNLIMAHALKRILFCTADTKKSLFAMVARNPQTGADGVYCHVFLLPSKEKVGMLTHSLSVPRTHWGSYAIHNHVFRKVPSWYQPRGLKNGWLRACSSNRSPFKIFALYKNRTLVTCTFSNNNKMANFYAASTVHVTIFSSGVKF